MGTIYVIRNDINGKCYVGQTVQRLAKRMSGHLTQSRRRKPNQVISQAIAKYGWENFSVEALEEADGVGLDVAECVWIERHQSFGRGGYNSALGGHLNRKVSDETRRKISEALTGNKLTDSHRAAIRVGRIGTPVSEETKKMMSAAHRGVKRQAFSIEHRENMKRAKAGENHPQAKLTWDSVREMRRLSVEGRVSQKALSVRFHVDPGTVSRILANKSWVEDCPCVRVS